MHPAAATIIFVRFVGCSAVVTGSGEEYLVAHVAADFAGDKHAMCGDAVIEFLPFHIEFGTIPQHIALRFRGYAPAAAPFLRSDIVGSFQCGFAVSGVIFGQITLGTQGVGAPGVVCLRGFLAPGEVGAVVMRFVSADVAGGPLQAVAHLHTFVTVEKPIQLQG